jgi:uncharacterized protein (TIGR03435 family)
VFHQKSYRNSNWKTLGIARGGISEHGGTMGMAEFARFLGNKLGVPVADQTGLPGLFDIHVRWDVPLGQVANAQPGDEAADTLRAAVHRKGGSTALAAEYGSPSN